MKRAAIVAPVRTPIGKFLGALQNVPSGDLATIVTRAVVERSGIDPALIEDVVFAQSYANSEFPCIGRWAALDAGLPIEVPGSQVDRRCGSGLQAIANAAMMVQSGAADVVIAGGVESMSNIEYYTNAMRGGARAGSVMLHDRLDRGRERSQPVHRFGVISGMIETAENVAKAHDIGREEADGFALRSQQHAAAAARAGLFREELIPVVVPAKRKGGDPTIFSEDESFRSDVTIEALARLDPILPGGTVTPGNASQQNDAAAACLVVAEDKLARLGLDPMAFLVGWTAVGCHPATMGVGPVPATRKLLAKTGLRLADIDLIEVNEAFAAQALACCRLLEIEDLSRVNVNGSGISLGHPIGATGVRIMVTMLHEMWRRKARHGLETMCIGGGQGMAAIFEAAW